MLKEALEYLKEQMEHMEIKELGGQFFSTKKLYPIAEAVVNPFNIHSLSGLVDYLKSSFDDHGNLMVHVVTPTTVEVFSTYNRDRNRNVIVRAHAMIPDFDFDRFHDTENFNIKLQSCFTGTPDKEIMLKVVGNIKEEDVRTVGDDGTSQSVTAKTGIAQVGDVMVPNPVELSPYRTFVEVIQPKSEFIFRMRSGPSCGLFEADGGAWRIEAMANIEEYLLNHLEDQIASESIIIIS